MLYYIIRPGEKNYAYAILFFFITNVWFKDLYTLYNFDYDVKKIRLVWNYSIHVFQCANTTTRCTRWANVSGPRMAVTNAGVAQEAVSHAPRESAVNITTMYMYEYSYWKIKALDYEYWHPLMQTNYIYLKWHNVVFFGNEGYSFFLPIIAKGRKQACMNSQWNHRIVSY